MQASIQFVIEVMKILPLSPSRPGHNAGCQIEKLLLEKKAG
jgi:hypothetical protein